MRTTRLVHRRCPLRHVGVAGSDSVPGRSAVSRSIGSSIGTLTHRSSRRGLTLFEVLIALVIFVGAMAAIGQLVSNGVRAALQARFQTQAAMLCEAKVAEVVAGIVPLTPGQGTYPDDPSWSWSLALASAPVPGLMRVEVIVQRQAANAKGQVVFTMARYVRDPQVYLAAQQEAERIEQEQAEAAE